MADYDLSNLTLQMTCPNNKLIIDDKGKPSVMVYIPKFKISDVLPGGSSSTHPAFIVNGTEIDGIWISKFQNIIQDGRAYSLPGVDPKASLDFDTARNACEAKGPGWHLMTNAEWAAIALWCKKIGHQPKGNNNYGKDSTEALYKAIPMTKGADGNIYHVATGTGPIEWSHDKTLSGIWDLNGNVWEWAGGYRLVDGEIQILPNNDAADPNNSQSSTSVLWKAILQNGNLVAPGTANSLKWDYLAAPGDTGTKAFRLNTQVQFPQIVEIPYGAQTFETLAAATGVTVPEIMKALALFPAETGYEGDYAYMRTLGERLAFRGSLYGNGAHAGVFAVGLNYPRSRVSPSVGFRSAFIGNL